MTEPTTPTADPIRRIFTATLIIGPSGKGKTSLAATFAEYLWETFHKVLLLASCDGGAFPTVIQKRIRQGLIRAWRMRTRSAEGLAFETCHLASKGYWPKTINPETGETSPAVVLVPPVTTKYDCYCGKGHHLRTVPSPTLVVPMFCSECKEMVTLATMKVAETAHQTRGFEQVGGEFFDGLTSMCGWFMGEMDLGRGHGNIGGEKPPLGGPVRSGDIVFGGNNRADYGFSQQRAHQIVHNSLGIPNLCEGPVFTGLPDEVSESGVLLPSIGLKLSGSALSADSMQWFGNVVEAAIEKSDNGSDIRRLYLSEYVDPQNRRHLLKNSGPGTLPKYLEDPPINADAPDARNFFSGFHLGHFYKLLDQALRDSLAADDGVKDTPGIGAAPVDYGETLAIEPGAGTAPPATTGGQPTQPPTAVATTGIPALHLPQPMPGPSTSPTVAPTPRARSRKPLLTMPPNGTAAAASAPAPPPPTAAAPVEVVAPVVQPVPTPEPVATPQQAAPPPATPTPAAALPTTVAAPPAVAPRARPRPSGTVAPPPPVMRPPQRAPGA